MYKQTSIDLMEFIKNSPTAFHAVRNIKNILLENGYEELLEGKAWNIEPGKKYFVTRNMSSVIALNLGNDLSDYSFNIAASHSDSPTFKLKENKQLEVKGKYTQLNTEGYGGMLCATWFDRPLSIAGRVLVKEGNSFVSKLVKFDRDLVLIPNFAIHMKRDVNEGFAYNKQIDLLPLFGDGSLGKNAFDELLANELDVNIDDIYSSDLFLYNRMPYSIWGANEEYMSCPQLDDLQCAWTSLQGLLAGSNSKSIDVYACFDNEEVGSGTKQGANSTFLEDVLKRVNTALGKTKEDYYRAIASSFLLSCDNAHAVHPNHPEFTDANNCTYMNEGIVIKSHAGQKYCSDGVSIALFKDMAERANVPVQFFANRSDKAGGSTLGNIAMAHVSMNAVDIGLPQLAMHSSYETAGIKDTYYMIQACKKLYSCHLSLTKEDTIEITYED